MVSLLRSQYSGGCVMAREKGIVLVKEVVEQTRNLVTNENYEEAKFLVEHNECLVALELLCDQIYELDSIVSAELYQKIEEAGLEFGLGKDRLEYVKEMVKG